MTEQDKSTDDTETNAAAAPDAPDAGVGEPSAADPEIFGVADKMGSIEVGKSANLFVCDGDPLETKTNVNHVFIEGWQIPMVSRHTELYDEFLKREPGLKKTEK
jgi:hypothetical protein